LARILFESLRASYNPDNREAQVMKRTIFTCDIRDCGETTDISEVHLDVIFTTEQTEGRTVPNHICKERLDLCPKCHAKVLQGNYIFAHGAQGHNTYYFPHKEARK